MNPSPGSDADTADDADVAEVVAAFERHGSRFVIVGGVAAKVLGSGEPTARVQLVVDYDRSNLSRVARALAELDARLRVDGLADADARALRLAVDAESLALLDVSTWTTDRGAVDVLSYLLVDAEQRLDYAALFQRTAAVDVTGHAVPVALTGG